MGKYTCNMISMTMTYKHYSLLPLPSILSMKEGKERSSWLSLPCDADNARSGHVPVHTQHIMMSLLGQGMTLVVGHGALGGKKG
jgi:hypothetical protein